MRCGRDAASAPASGLISMPEIPSYGELSIFYDMYALAFGAPEVAREALGDPLSLVFGEGIQLIELYRGSVPFTSRACRVQTPGHFPKRM